MERKEREEKRQDNNDVNTLHSLLLSKKITIDQFVSQTNNLPDINSWRQRNLILLPLAAKEKGVDYKGIFNNLNDIILTKIVNSRNILDAAFEWNKVVQNINSLDDENDIPIFYREHDELLLIRNVELIGSLYFSNSDPDLFTEKTPIKLDEEYKSETDRPKVCLDFTVFNSDQDIKEYIDQGRGIAIWNRNKVYCINLHDITKLFDRDYQEEKRPDAMNLDTVVYYQCPIEKPKPNEDVQYFLIRLEINFLVPLNDIRMAVKYNYEKGVKIFKLEPALDQSGKQIKLEYTMSHGAAINYFVHHKINRSGGMLISADHCQAGSDKNLYRLYPVQSELNSNVPVRSTVLDPRVDSYKQLMKDIDTDSHNILSKKAGEYISNMKFFEANVVFDKLLTIVEIKSVISIVYSFIKVSPTSNLESIGKYISDILIKYRIGNHKLTSLQNIPLQKIVQDNLLSINRNQFEKLIPQQLLSRITNMNTSVTVEKDIIEDLCKLTKLYPRKQIALGVVSGIIYRIPSIDSDGRLKKILRLVKIIWSSDITVKDINNIIIAQYFVSFLNDLIQTGSVHIFIPRNIWSIITADINMEATVAAIKYNTYEDEDARRSMIVNLLLAFDDNSSYEAEYKIEPEFALNILARTMVAGDGQFLIDEHIRDNLVSQEIKEIFDVVISERK